MTANSERKPLQSIYKECMTFIDGFQTVVLATLNKNSEPDSSYAPVFQENQRFYIYISELASHTFNLLENPRASMLFIEPEEKADHLFARQRVTIRVNAATVERDSEQWADILNKMEGKFGEIIQMLRPLEDFHLFELTPESINYVRGFAQAYTLTGDDLDEVTHLRDRGHGKKRA
ncbi:HugZ family protein [Hydrogenovibrio marinus]|uniref:Pyridoxamine 5'-phosphate oxidase N-terminal domain-containing protein n=1 Tax=Hydrogenovibrio marinus TaxID=28885 RepID=A0A067A0I1_HYDMR|nr:pyridoxamine 5'-phosphate oxidase family protein [Hydrogenovibrio marinus]KDN95870.1 hypothetical protein EI16_06135 [Hydrogenovibrio marinus]BBN58642.1 heme utilization protein HutZ [Hydrogenovibrio marinus]